MSEQTSAGKPRDRRYQRKQWWKQPIEKWSSYLISIGAQGVKTSGSRIALCCPYHADENPSASLNVVRGGFKCWSAHCGHTEHDPIKLVERVLGCSYAEAFDSYRRFFNLTRVITPDELTGFYQDENRRRQLKLTADALHYYACSVWMADTSPETAKNTVKWLKGRGVEDVSKIQSLGLMPRSADLEKSILALGGSKEDADAAKRFLSLGLNTQLMDSVVFIYARSVQEITAFKLRVPGPEKEIRTIRLDEDDMGAFGVFDSVYAPYYNHDKITHFTVVEGEFDQIALYQGQLLQGCADEIVFALGGAGHTGIAFAADLGFTQCNIIGDDDEGGESYPANILKTTKEIGGRIFVWPPVLKGGLPGKTDPDEAVKIHGFEKAYTEFFDEDNYVYAPQWCARKANEALESVSEDNVIEVQAVATQWASYLRNETERALFAGSFEKAHPQLDSKTLLKEVTRHQGGPLGFEIRLTDWISAVFHPMYMDTTVNELHMWHKVQRMEVVFRLGTAASAATFRAFVPGGSLYQWVHDDIGLPVYFPDVEADDATQVALDKTDTLIEKALDRALYRIGSTAPKNTDSTLGQGIHLHKIAKGGPGYIVNGTRIYKFHYKNGSLADVIELDGPSDDGIVFDIEYNSTLCPDYTVGWADYLRSVEDITRPPAFTLNETVDHVQTIINRLFGFENQPVDVALCTCFVFYTNILTCITRYRSVVHVQGLFESGKTTLLSIIGNSSQLGEYSLTRHAAGLVTFTQAAFFQSFKNCALIASLDEMNDPDDRSIDSAQKQSIWMNLRTLVTSGKTHKVIGTRGGNARPYTLFNSVITAAATPIVHDMDASRAVTIKMRKKEGMENARALLPELLPQTFIQNLRHSIFHHALQIAGKVPKKYTDLYAAFTEDAQHNSTQGLDRSLENVMPLAAIAEMLNLNGLQLLKDYRNSRQEGLKERKDSTQEHAVLDAILSAPRIELDLDTGPRMHSIRSLLLDYDNREKINVAAQGVYYDVQSQCLAIAWDNIAGLLAGTRYAAIAKASMKSLADQTEYFIPTRDAEKKGILSRLKAAGLAGARLYSIYDVSYILSDLETALHAVQKDQTRVEQQATTSAS